MTFQNQQNGLQVSFYTQMAYNMLKIHSIPNNKIVSRNINAAYDHSNQLLNGLDITDMAIGDTTIEIMKTTLGKIPNEMYYLEDTTPSGKTAIYDTELQTVLDSSHTTLALFEIVKSDRYSGCSTLLLVLLSILLIILVLCCITACIIAKSRKKHTFFAKSDIECNPGCGGVNQPLLGLGKTSDTTTKTNSSLTNN